MMEIRDPATCRVINWWTFRYCTW